MNMKKTLMAAVALLGGIAMAADSTYSFTYQAALRDEHGLVISNGMSVARNQTVTLRLWDAPTGGNVLWGRTYNVYTDETGLFNLEVTDTAGSRSADAPTNAALESVFTNKLAGTVYIGLFVKGSSGEIVPRQRLFAVPFAAVANDVRKISGDITVGGQIKMMGKDGTGITISAEGINHTSAKPSVFQDITANGAVTTIGAITSGGGLVVNGGTVSIKPDVTLDRKLTVSGSTKLTGGITGGVTVNDGDVALDAGRKVTVGGSEVVPVPVGGVIMWTKTTPPEGGSWSGYKSAHWAICNGQNGTPDLRGRFVVGANNDTTGKKSDFSTYSPDPNSTTKTGGSQSVTLNESQMPVHSHYYLQDRDAGPGEDSSYYSYNYGSMSSYSSICTGWSSYSGSGSIWQTGTAGGNSKVTAKGTSTSSHENRPPYYALYYIMRIN